MHSRVKFIAKDVTCSNGFSDLRVLVTSAKLLTLTGHVKQGGRIVHVVLEFPPLITLVDRTERQQVRHSLHGRWQGSGCDLVSRIGPAKGAGCKLLRRCLHACAEGRIKHVAPV